MTTEDILDWVSGVRTNPELLAMNVDVNRVGEDMLRVIVWDPECPIDVYQIGCSVILKIIVATGVDGP